jgi:hypothetical protein
MLVAGRISVEFCGTMMSAVIAGEEVNPRESTVHVPQAAKAALTLSLKLAPATVDASITVVQLPRPQALLPCHLTPMGLQSETEIDDEPAVTMAIGLLLTEKPVIFDAGTQEADESK